MTRPLSIRSLHAEIWKRFQAYRGRFTISCLLTLVSSLFNAAGFGLMIPLVGLIIGEGDALDIPLIGGLMNYVYRLPFSELVDVSVAIALMFLLKNLFSYVALRYATTFQLGLMADLRAMTIDHLFRIPLNRFIKWRSGDLLVVLNRDSGQTALICEDVRQLLGFFLNIAFYGALLLSRSVDATLFCLVMSIAFYLPLRWAHKRLAQLGQDALEDAKSVSQFGIEVTSGFRLIRERSNEANEARRYDSILKKFNLTQLAITLAREISRFMTEILGVLCLISIVCFWKVTGSTVWFSTQAMSSGDFFQFLIFFSRVIPGVQQIINQYGTFAGRLAGAVNLSNYLDESSKETVATGSAPFGRLESLEVRDLTYSYDGETDVLSDVSFRVPRGGSIAVVGESGAGKSTLLTLLYAFNEARQGGILVNGRSLLDYDIVSWRRRISCVSQDTFLFNLSVRDNITYGAGAFSEDDYLEALRRSGSAGFIESLPDGDRTMLGERGVRLSGGQAQRIAIARAILVRPELLILDEATSALDSLTEIQVQKCIRELSDTITTLTIAHRLSTISHCDQIVVLRAGRIAESGTHDQLLSAGGEYATMWDAQSRG